MRIVIPQPSLRAVLLGLVFTFTAFLFAFALAVPLALGAEVVTKHRSEDEILLGR